MSLMGADVRQAVVLGAVSARRVADNVVQDVIVLDMLMFQTLAESLKQMSFKMQ